MNNSNSDLDVTKPTPELNATPTVALYDHLELFHTLQRMFRIQTVDFEDFKRFLQHSPDTNILRWYGLQVDSSDFYLTESLSREYKLLMLPASKLVIMPQASDLFFRLSHQNTGWIPLSTHGPFIYLANYDPFEPLPQGIPAFLVQRVILTANSYDYLFNEWRSILDEKGAQTLLELGAYPTDTEKQVEWLQLLDCSKEAAIGALDAINAGTIPFPIKELSLKLLNTRLDKEYLLLQQFFPFHSFNGNLYVAYGGDMRVLEKQLEVKLSEYTPIFFKADPDELEAELRTIGVDEAVAQAPQSLLELNENDPVSFLDGILTHALDMHISDIHIEPVPTEPYYRFRLRLDGVLLNAMRVPKRNVLGLINLIKLNAGLNISDKNQPKDSCFSHKVKGCDYDIRVSTIPQGDDAEQVVLRILDSRKVPNSLEELGFSTSDILLINKALGFEHGLVLISGPTGSGKTTTLYAAIRSLSLEQFSLQSAEDPIEYRMEHSSQFSVKPDMGITYEKLLRHILRSDPDYIMIGEIRDASTAQTAFVAANTGHLVLSTIHANDSISSVFRLCDLGVPQMLLADATRLILSQRLLRKLCGKCRIRRPMTAPERSAFVKNGFSAACIQTPLHFARGCHACNYTGYKHRFAVAESLFFTPEVAEAVTHGNSRKDLKGLLIKQGFSSMYRAGLARVLSGETSFQEISDLAMVSCL